MRETETKVLPVLEMSCAVCAGNVEFMLAGATAIQIGTYNFVDPAVGIKVIEGMNDYCDRHGFSSVRELIGALEV